MNHPSKGKQAFTLIELLVTIAIIVILASILFPVFSRARENARRATCASNLKQLGYAHLMYAQDNDGGMAPYLHNGSANWSELRTITYLYVKNNQIYRCPDMPPLKGLAITDWRAPTYGYPMKTNPHGWVARPNETRAGKPRAMKFDAVPDAARTCLLFESQYFIAKDAAKGWGYSQSTDHAQALTRHLEGSNYLFVDGHVKWLNSKVIKINFVTQNLTAKCAHSSGTNDPIVFCWDDRY